MKFRYTTRQQKKVDKFLMKFFIYPGFVVAAMFLGASGLLAWISYLIPVHAQQLTSVNLQKPKVVTLNPKLIKPCQCESQSAQFNKFGSPIINKNKDGSVDWGFCQINDKHWNDYATAHNLDYRSDLAANVILANYIYEQQGVKAWHAYNAKTGKCVWEK